MSLFEILVNISDDNISLRIFFLHLKKLKMTVKPKIRNSWVSLCKYAVNLSGGQPQLY